LTGSVADRRENQVQARDSRYWFDEVVRRVLVTNKAILFAIVLAAVLSYASPYFFTTTNLFSLLQQIVTMTVVALAYTMLLGAGEIDLSVGAIVALVGIIMAKFMVIFGVPWYLAVIAGIVAGGLCGAVNAALVSLFRLPPFIVTLATNAIFTGILLVISNLIPVSGLPAAFVAIGQGKVGPVPISVLVAVPLAIVMYVLAKASVFGQHVVALGGNVEALRVAGVRISGVRTKVYVLTGMFCGIASVLLTARSASAQIGAGSNLLLLVIAAVVVGGTPLLGGRVDIVGTIFGCLIIGMINNGINLLGVSANFQILTQGVLILLALLADVQSTQLLLNMAKRRLQREEREGR
jgi:ribose/xylose/arabinose/galactoside ABC-type transport system permease subunit